MKTNLIFLSVILGCGLVKATTTTSVSQDKPDRLYVESYTDNERSEEIEQFDYYDSNGNPAPNEYGYIWWNDDPQDTYTVNWNDGSIGNALWKEHDIFISNVTNTTGDGWSMTYWPTSSWPNISTGTVTNFLGDTDTAGSPVILESCDTGVPLVDETGSYLWPPPDSYRETIIDFATRHAHAKMKLQTGGRSGSRLHNLFGFTASATQIIGVKDPLPFTYNLVRNVPIPQQKIVLGSLGNLNATGTTYRILPDDSPPIDVTPTVAGVDYYTFIVNRQKYHSYYDLYVQQANPGYSFYPAGEYDVGHAFWQFRTEAPSDALQYISTNLTVFLGQSWGFYPTNDPPLSLWNLATVPGLVSNDGSHSHNIRRTFYIGFPDLLNGLEFTKGIYNAPPEWSASGYNCVSAARGAGFTADVFALPWDMTPQNFGVTLVQMYPGPFEDDTDIFYSTAPY